MDDSRQCHGRSKRSQLRCKRAAILGGTVCSFHGGKSPQVVASARERIALMVDPALVALRRLIDTADSDSVRLSAIKDILDRAGYKPVDRADINMSGSGVQIYLPARTEQPTSSNGHTAATAH
jgi:hypothetical protein